jgi:CheY-specific phosphatase CheX
MTPTSNRPDLQHIGQSAFTEVLSVLLSLPATVGNSSSHSSLSSAPDRITGTVLLTGQQISGCVHVLLPLAFVAHAVHLLTGLDGAAPDGIALLDDTAGELANMVAGRAAVQLAAAGFPCTLGTPSVSRSASLPVETEPGMDHGRTDLFCDGHWLSLELKCRYAVS